MQSANPFEHSFKIIDSYPSIPVVGQHAPREQRAAFFLKKAAKTGRKQSHSVRCCSNDWNMLIVCGAQVIVRPTVGIEMGRTV